MEDNFLNDIIKFYLFIYFFLHILNRKITHQTNCVHIPWKIVAEKLNLSGITEEKRNTNSCQERWKNTLQASHNK